MTPTVEIMQKCVYDLFLEKGWRYFAPNTQAIGWESDLLGISKSYYSAEFEIKISRADYRKDFVKEKHSIFNGDIPYSNKYGKWRGPNYFYFVVPEGLVKKEEVPDYAGLIYVCTPQPHQYRQEYGAITVKEPKKLHRDKVKEQTIYNMARSLMYRHFYKIDITLKNDFTSEPPQHLVQQDQISANADAA